MYDDEFSWLQWRKSNEDVNNSIIDVDLCGCVPIALNEVRILQPATLECCLEKQRSHEKADI